MNHIAADETSELDRGVEKAASRGAEARNSSSGLRAHPPAPLIPRHYLFPDSLEADGANCIGVAKKLSSQHGLEARRGTACLLPPPVADKFLPEGISIPDFLATSENMEDEQQASGAQGAETEMIEEDPAAGAFEDQALEEDSVALIGADSSPSEGLAMEHERGLSPKIGNLARRISAGTLKRGYVLAALGALVTTAAIPVLFMNRNNPEQSGDLQTRLEDFTGQVAGNTSTFLGNIFRHDKSTEKESGVKGISLPQLSVSSQEAADEGVIASRTKSDAGVPEAAPLPAEQPLLAAVEAKPAEVQEAPSSESVPGPAAEPLAAEEAVSNPVSALEALEVNSPPAELPADVQILKGNVPWDPGQALEVGIKTTFGKQRAGGSPKSMASAKSAPRSMASAKSAPKSMASATPAKKKHHGGKTNVTTQESAKAAANHGADASTGVTTTQPVKVASVAVAAPVASGWEADRRNEMNALIQSGNAARDRGKLLYASMQFEEALKMATSLKDEKKQSWLRNHLGQCYLLLGEARMRNLRSAEDCREARDLFMKAFVQGFTGERNQNNILLMNACLEDSTPGRRSGS